MRHSRRAADFKKNRALLEVCGEVQSFGLDRGCVGGPHRAKTLLLFISELIDYMSKLGQCKSFLK
jgi:hypothetical protein